MSILWYVGSSASGFFADKVHYNQYGSRIGESWTDEFGTTRHYGNNGRVGTSYHRYPIRVIKDDFHVMLNEYNRHILLACEPFDHFHNLVTLSTGNACSRFIQNK